MTAVARFKSADLDRALKCAKKNGIRVTRFEIDPNGKIVILSERGAPATAANEWDEVLQ